MWRSIVFLGLAVAGCTTTEEAMRRDQRAWIGRPVRAFGEGLSLVPEATYDMTPAARTFIFRKPGAFGASCGITITGAKRAGFDEWVIGDMTSTCPPGSF